MIELAPLSVTAWQFPQDAIAGKQAFLKHWEHPQETWLRAYALTMRELVNVMVPAQRTAPQHVYVDRSQSASPEQLVLLKELVAAGVEVTVGTSPAGKEFIAHSKAYTSADGSSWMGSWNFSESASSQVNDAFAFKSELWRDSTIKAFEEDVQYAWTVERGFQIMPAPPKSYVAPKAASNEYVSGLG